MKVSARFICRSVTHTEATRSVEFGAIWTGHPEDNDYSKATPYAEMKMQITNDAVFSAFAPGEVYDILITPHADEKPE